MTGNTRVESLGVYLPERRVTSREVIDGCRKRLCLPLERMTGIQSRRAAGETEFSLDLAKGAMARCLAKSSHDPIDIDLIIAANISKTDAPGTLSIEPNTAVGLRQHFGLHRAVAFDLVNACAGMFTAILVVDELIRRGDIRRALVVSGDYITVLTGAAQRVLQDARDPRLACLTLGDAGACLLLEQGNSFEFMDLYTVPQHADLCVADWAAPSGPIMRTDSIALAGTTMAELVSHFHALAANGCVVDDPDFIIPHQTSSRSIRESADAINRHFGRTICHRDKIVDNLARRGNTAASSHWVALNDLVEAGALRPGQRVLFGIAGSGITVGLAQYRVDEFADISRNGQRSRPRQRAPAHPVDGEKGGYYKKIPDGERARVVAAATLAGHPAGVRGNVELAARAAEMALGTGEEHPVGLLIYSGVYRENFICEPALATLVAREIGGGPRMSNDANPLLAFDILNGPPGVLTSCQVAGRLLLSRIGVAVVAASEYNETSSAGEPLDVADMGSALVLERSLDATGFRSFYYRRFPEHFERYRSFAQSDPSGPRLHVVRDPRLHGYYLDALTLSVSAMLRREGLTLDDYQVIFPPQIAPEFAARLTASLQVEETRLVTCGPGNLFTSGMAASWEAVEARDTSTRELGLFLAVGPGIEVACATYAF